jgi:hypothetical protein
MATIKYTLSGFMISKSICRIYTCICIFAFLNACNCNKKEIITQNNLQDNTQDRNVRVDKNNNNLQQNIEEDSGKDGYDNRRGNLKLSLSDTIKLSKSYFFSNSASKDLFQLVIRPGMVKSSKSELHIITSDKRLIYSDTFDTHFFMRGVYEPDTMPPNLDQDEYLRYLDKYWKSIKVNQYEAYFKKSIKQFYEYISFVNRTELKDFTQNQDGLEIDNEILKEVLADKTIKVMDITCFDCDEGGIFICYSKKQKKIVKFLWHD